MSVFLHYLLWSVKLAPAETQTTAAERDALARYVAGRRCVVEIGVWHGVTTRRLRGAMAADGVLFAIDPYPVGRLGVSFQQRIARAEVSAVRNGQVRWVRETGAEAARTLTDELTGRVEFAFIDGDHSYDGLAGDWNGWSQLIAAGGIVALHDSRPTAGRPIEDAGSVRFTAEVIRSDPRFELVEEVDSLTALRRVG